MGSFNTTCFASQQTISTGNECYIIPIVQNMGYTPVECTYKGKDYSPYGVTDSTCYPTAFWTPFTNFIAATYDDYGQVKLNEDKDNLLKVQDFFTKLGGVVFKTAQGENEYHDVPFDFAEIGKDTPPDIFKDWDYLWGAVHEHRVFVRNYKGVPAALQFAIISKPSYDYLVALSDAAVGWDDKSRDRKVVIANLAGVCKAVVAEDAVTFADIPEVDTRFSKFSIRNEITKVVGGSRQEGMPNLPSMRLDDYVEERLSTGTLSEETQALMVKDMETSYVFSALTELNIKLTPLVYASQDYDNSIGAEYAKFINTVSDIITKGQVREYDDDE